MPRPTTPLDCRNPAPAEVFVIDNGSTDESLALLQAWIEQTKGVNVRLLREAKPGASAARNTGIRAARGDIVAFTDSDCVPQSDWLSHLLAPFDDADTGAVAGRIAGVFDRTLCEMFCSLYTLQSAGETTTHREWTPWSGGFPTANLAVRRRLLEQLDGFDETVKIYGEDYDLCARQENHHIDEGEELDASVFCRLGVNLHEFHSPFPFIPEPAFRSRSLSSSRIFQW